MANPHSASSAKLSSPRAQRLGTVTFVWRDFEMPNGRGGLFDVLERAAATRAINIRLIFWRPDEEISSLRTNALGLAEPHRLPRCPPIPREAQGTGTAVTNGTNTRRRSRFARVIQQQVGDNRQYMLDGNEGAEVYRELRKIAAIHLRRSVHQPSLQATQLVHEVWLRLESRGWKSRTHYLALASKAMRGILVDMARARLAAKRTPAPASFSIGLADSQNESGLMPMESVIEVSRLLDQLAIEDARKAKVVELRFFGGLEFHEIAECLDISLATAKRDWEFSRLWLFSRLNAKPAVSASEESPDPTA